MKPYFSLNKKGLIYGKKCFEEEVTFNKCKQESGAIHFFKRNHASGLVFKFPRGLECFSSKSFIYSFFFER